ncbi:MAG TPA: D-2-hydroxyacid dehydrogenase, partial [Polyangiaceae bacterium]|nr:D-2-hydroxyacid dehydrogenase [Polyangiaceae bacterium]
LVAERGRGAQVLLTNKAVIDAEALASLPDLRGICVLATGYNVVDVAAARARRIPVSNVPSYSTPSVIEHTFALLFELCRAVGKHDDAVHAGEWVRALDFSFVKSSQRELAGRTFGVVGYGEIGKGVARAASAFGLRVLATPSRRSPPEPFVEVRSTTELVRECDILSLHCPLTAETEKMVNTELLSTMKPTSLLINTARGALVDEAALARALERGVIAGAALDVLSTEPPAAENPLLTAPNCIITPHLAWTSIEARQRLVTETIGNVRGILTGNPRNVVNGV